MFAPLAQRADNIAGAYSVTEECRVGTSVATFSGYKHRLSDDHVGHLRECHECEPIFAETEVLSKENNLCRRLLREFLATAARGHTVKQTTFIRRLILRS